ncbi:MAG: hypothetical protein EHM77_04640, partial [Planctomycetaceae bacterium]
MVACVGWKRLAAGRCCRSAVVVCLLGYLLTDGALGLRGQDSAGGVAESSVEKPVRTLVYNRDVRPVLAEHCFACHGPDSAAREADLRLDQRDGAVASGAIKSGDPDESELIRRIRLTDQEDGAMPPAAVHRRLTEAEKAVLSRWIAEGAEYQPHWSFIAPVRPALPEVAGADWVRNPIDRFILAEL